MASHMLPPTSSAISPPTPKNSASRVISSVLNTVPNPMESNHSLSVHTWVKMAKPITTTAAIARVSNNGDRR